MSEVKLVVDGARMAELLRGPTGPVWRHLEARAELFQVKAREDAPIRTGCLRSRIRKRNIEEVGDKLSITVMSDTAGCGIDAAGKVTNKSSNIASGVKAEYAFFIHEGTQPHDIPNAFGYGPTFGIGGRFDGKFHPGNRAYRYLSKNLSMFTND